MSINDPTLEEFRLLTALMNMCQQYLSGPFAYISHDFMSAGEHAVEALASYGLLQPEPGGGTLTERGLFVANLRGVDEATFNEVRQRYLAIDENRSLESIPDMWHSPNLTICSLKFWFQGLAVDRVPEGSPRRRWLEADRLYVLIQIRDFDASARIQGELFTLSDLGQFRNELEKIHQKGRGAARLRGTKDSLKLRVNLNRDGALSGDVTLTNINFRHSHTFELPFAAHENIPALISSIDAAVEKFEQD